MNIVKVIQYYTVSGLLVVNAAIAGDTSQTYVPVVSGYASFEAGKIVEGYSSVTSEPEVRRAWLETGYVGLCIEAAVSKRLRVLVAGEAQPVISFRRAEGNMNDAWTEARQPRTVVVIKHGEAIYTIGSADHPLLQVEAGFFPYKYNQEARNLGEYLFRTYCYPASIVNQFDKPYADLVGFRVGNSLAAGPGCFHHDLLLTTSTNFWPFMNWSPSYLADYSVPRLFTVGVGGQLWNLIKVGINNSQVGKDPTSPTDPQVMNGKEFSFFGGKLMARLSIDVKGLFRVDAPLAAMLGKEDLKLYGEAAILGVKNYPDTTTDQASQLGYDKLPWRLPVVVGINLPAFKVLDVLNFELEFQDSPYPNSIMRPVYNMAPLPAARQRHAKFKWSVYAKKDIGPHVSLIFQVARDHIMPLSTVTATNFSDYTDVLLRNTDWWWTGKIWCGF
ncbi:MAG: hypothetical protein JW913_17415 [Chitinispirillaceae bacterium]|nr:hypothetical protein [Chitinispirillaceae bacterium]